MKTEAAVAVTTQYELAGSFIDHDLARRIIQPDRWQLDDAPPSVEAFLDLATDTPESRGVLIQIPPAEGSAYPCVRRPLAEGRGQLRIYDRYPSLIPHIFSDFVTEESSPATDPHREFIAESIERERRAWHDRRAYESRIEALRADAELDELTINVASEQDFWDFVRSTSYLRRASLAVMNNGNIRAVWKAEDSSHLGIHFLGDGEVQYVIFRLRSYGRRVSRVAGSDTLSGIKNQIAAFDLVSLMYR